MLPTRPYQQPKTGQAVRTNGCDQKRITGFPAIRFLFHGTRNDALHFVYREGGLPCNLFE